MNLNRRTHRSYGPLTFFSIILSTDNRWANLWQHMNHYMNLVVCLYISLAR
jgi:hypothetical protein